MADNSSVDVDVLIVGAGPVGMLGGILASRHGLTALVVERRDGPQTSPAAHVGSPSSTRARKPCSRRRPARARMCGSLDASPASI